jgi:Cu/Ag efflux pump CusA
VIKSFLAGAITGAAVMWFWGDEIRGRIDDATSGVRTRAAEQLHGVADTLQSVAQTVDQGLTGTPQQRVS